MVAVLIRLVTCNENGHQAATPQTGSLGINISFFFLTSFILFFFSFIFIGWRLITL